MVLLRWPSSLALRCQRRKKTPRWQTVAFGCKMARRFVWVSQGCGCRSERKRFPLGDTISESQANYFGDTRDYRKSMGGMRGRRVGHRETGPGETVWMSEAVVCPACIETVGRGAGQATTAAFHFPEERSGFGTAVGNVGRIGSLIRSSPGWGRKRAP